MLDSVLRQGQTLSAAAERIRGLQGSDLKLALAIAGEVLRRLPALDRWIDSATSRPLPDDSKARMVLRLALAQKLGLGTPDHALVATALPLVEGGARRLVHGVLGTLLRADNPQGPNLLPHPVEQRWIEQWGQATVDCARRLIVQRPPLDLSFSTASQAAEFCAQTGAECLAERSARIASASVTGLPGFEDGHWWVQDISASLPARLVRAQRRNVLDLCAAPGGKTMQLAAAGHRVTALDLSQRRLERVAQNLARTGQSVDIVTANALDWAPPAPFDSILLDAPCSATGTFRRHPEVLFRARPPIIAEMADLQRRLLRRSARWLERGGELIYASCSLERREGEDVICAFLSEHADFRIEPPERGELPDFAGASEEGWIRVLPGVLEDLGGCDGFFIARLVRAR